METLANLEAESSILGALLMDNSLFDKIEGLSKKDFYLPQHAEIYAEIEKQLLEDKSCDITTVFEALSKAFTFEEISGLCQYVPSHGNLRRYCDLVKSMAKSRQLMQCGEEITNLGKNNHVPVNERIEEAHNYLSQIVDSTPKDEWVGAYVGMMQHTTLIEDRAAGKIKTMSTGLIDLDEKLDGGLATGTFTVIGARPSVGKTALGMTIGLNMAQDYTVGMFSMEMPHRDIRDRMTAMVGNVPLYAVKRPNKGLAWDRVVEGVERAKTLNFYVSDQSGLNINQLRSKARNLKRMFGLNVLIVDYIGLMSGTDSKQPRVYQLAEVSRGLKQLSKELDIAIVCLAQVNRASTENKSEKPRMHNLRDSGDIENDADVVLLLHRQYQASPECGEQFKHHAELSIEKNRQGATGKVDLFYDGERTKFSNWSGELPSVETFKRGRLA